MTSYQLEFWNVCCSLYHVHMQIEIRSPVVRFNDKSEKESAWMTLTWFVS